MKGGLLQKLKSCVNHAPFGCVKTLERAAESCHNFYFSRVVRDGCIESAPAHFPVLYLCIPCSRHERLREVCHMAAVIETKTESTLHYDLLQLVFPTQILFLRWVQESIKRVRHGIVRQYPNNAIVKISEANSHGYTWSFWSIKKIWEEGRY